MVSQPKVWDQSYPHFMAKQEMKWNWIGLAGGLGILVLGILNNTEIQMLTGALLIIASAGMIWLDRKEQQGRDAEEKPEDPSG